MRHFFQKSLLTVITTCAVLTLAACASEPVAVPNTGLMTAKEIVLQAQQSGAAEVAPLDIRLAQEKIEAAQQAFRDKKYVLADRLAKEAWLNAQVAEAKASKARMEKAAAELEESVQTLRRETIRQNQ